MVEIDHGPVTRDRAVIGGCMPRRMTRHTLELLGFLVEGAGEPARDVGSNVAGIESNTAETGSDTLQ